MSKSIESWTLEQLAKLGVPVQKAKEQYAAAKKRLADALPEELRAGYEPTLAEMEAEIAAAFTPEAIANIVADAKSDLFMLLQKGANEFEEPIPGLG